MLSRRDLVGKFGAGVAALCVAGAARAGFASVGSKTNAPGGGTPAGDPLFQPGPTSTGPQSARPQVVDAGPPATLAAPAPWELVRPLAMGSVVAHGWRVAGLTGAVDGSCVLTLQNERGRAHRVHLCRNDGTSAGPGVHEAASTCVVMNGGQGDLPTEEGFAQAVAEVAHVLAANEQRHGQPVVAALLPHAERLRRSRGRRTPA